MQISHRSYLTAGIAMCGAAAVALAPINPGAGVTTAATQTANIAVQLSSSIDPITPWVNTIVGAIDNIGGLAQAALANPFPILQQVISNQITYLGELPDIGLILNQVIGNVGNAFMAPFAESPLNINPTPSGTVLGGPLDHFTFYVLTVSDGNIGILTPEQIAQIKPIFDLLTIPATGALLGLVGPVVAPVLALVNSVGAIVDALGQADLIGALNELINIPANLTNAVLNGGQFLDLAPLAGLLGLALPSSITRFGLTMGGLLSQGAWTGEAPFAGRSGPGVGFDALDIGASVTSPFPINAVLNGLPLGPVGTIIGMGNQIAKSIAVTPPNAQVAAAEAPAVVAEAPAEAAALQASDVAAAVTAEVADASDAAPAPVVSAADVAAQTAAAADNDKAPAARESRTKAGRGGDNGSAGQDAPSRSAAKAGASRAG